MAEAQAAPHQHKQPSRKGKKAWRKNVDVTEIQSGLEEIRDEIIQGYDYNNNNIHWQPFHTPTR